MPVATLFSVLDDLLPHPEGNRYAERFRSELPHPSQITGTARGNNPHSFPSESGEFSAWHRVASEEFGCTPRAAALSYYSGMAWVR